MRSAPLGRELDPVCVEALATLLQLPADHVLAAWEQTRRREAYRTFRLDGGKGRVVQVPSELVATCQRHVLEHVLATGPISPAAYAGVRGRSPVTAAQRHLTDGREVLCMDLTDAYGHARYGLVTSALRRRLRPELRILSLGRAERAQVAGVMAWLLTAPGPGRSRRLPLGSPASVAAFNLVCLRMDREISELTAPLGPDVFYSRYVDDLVVSAPRATGTRQLVADITKIVKRHGFAPNDRKTTVGTSRQAVVLGLHLGPRGIEPSRDVIERSRLLISVATERLAFPDLSEAERRHHERSLRGLDAYLRRFYEAATMTRPPGLEIALPEHSGGIDFVDALWP